MTSSKPIPLAQLQRFAARMPGSKIVPECDGSWKCLVGENGAGLSEIWEHGGLAFRDPVEDPVVDARALYAALKVLFEECGSENEP